MEYYINKFSRMSIKQAVARDRQSHIFKNENFGGLF